MSAVKTQKPQELVKSIAPTKPTLRRVRPKAPTTLIVHVLDGRRYEGDGLEVLEIDSFLQAQIDAGKLEVL
jgi:hypothetical protein